MYRNIDAELKRQGLLRADLAKTLKITQTTLSNKMTGKNDFSLNEAKRIKHYLNVDIPLEILFDETPPPHLINAEAS